VDRWTLGGAVTAKVRTPAPAVAYGIGDGPLRNSFRPSCDILVSPVPQCGRQWDEDSLPTTLCG
jgi:hypothetical protein